jgi:hypothetical protein
MNPTQQHAFPNSRNNQRPNRSELAPASKNLMAFAVVYAGTNQALAVGEPKWMASLAIMAAVVGTGQKERPNVEDRMKMTNHVFKVMVTVSSSEFWSGRCVGVGVLETCSIRSISAFLMEARS